MGKIKSTKGVIAGKNLPLAQQISEEQQVKVSSRRKTRNQIEDDNVVDEKLSKRILEQARIQQDELEEEFGPSKSKALLKKTTSLGGKTQDSESSEDDDDVDDDDCKQNYEFVEVDADDQKAFTKFMNLNPGPRRTLADFIMEKITEKQTEIETQFSDPNSLKMPDLDERVEEVFKGVRQILRRYRSGKLPKAFKIIPTLVNWEQILFLTQPDSWTASAMYQATRIFAANLKEPMAQRFYNLVLLPRIRDDIDEFKRLNVHLYQALKKSLYKPGAFYKGILLPLCESGTCTLREAIIIGSVMAKNSIPILHSAAAMLKIAEMKYSGANSIFLRILFDKKYSLPFRVIDAVVFHFLQFQRDNRELPVLWHQALLVFVQRYKEDISSEQKQALCELLKVHVHFTITPEIRRELQNSKCRDEECDQPMQND